MLGLVISVVFQPIFVALAETKAGAFQTGASLGLARGIVLLGAGGAQVVSYNFV